MNQTNDVILSSSPNEKHSPTTRRDFLKKAIKLQGQFVAANVSVYIVGSAFKSLGGSLVAGAKWTAYNDGSPEYCNSSPPLTYGPYPDFATCDAARSGFNGYSQGCWPSSSCTDP